MVKRECIYCGKVTHNRIYQMRDSKFNSCTCRNIKHGMNRTKIYSVYANIKYRCYNENHHEWHNYGGKGIIMCDEWLGEYGFDNFYKWSKENGYQEGLTIDRIDSDGNYEPSNCQWITRSENTIKANKTCQHRKANKGTYYGIDTNGVRYEFDNANAFAEEHGLRAGNVRQVANGQNKSHQGWTFGFISDEINQIN